MSIFPYIYHMVQSFENTPDESQAALYAGMITSVFAFCECLASIFWGSCSDRIGRKPVLLIGMAGTGISMLMFGFASSLPLALFARCLGGALNG
jgi:MFS family permease